MSAVPAVLSGGILFHLLPSLAARAAGVHHWLATALSAPHWVSRPNELLCTTAPCMQPSHSPVLHMLQPQKGAPAYATEGVSKANRPKWK